MSRETLQWLNENTLIGFTDKHRKAWHHDGTTDNHYAGAIPVEDVTRRLFNWEAVEREVYVSGGPAVITEDGVSTPPLTLVPDRKAIVRSDSGHVMGIFGDGYSPHHYNQWLIKNVGSILDDSLSIGSAGLLRGGAVAWVSVEVPDTIVTPEGVEFRPNLLAVSSFDGSIATTYKRVVTNVVCDNTMAAGLREHGQQIRIKSTRNSLDRMGEARDALGIVHSMADDFAAEVKELTDQSFTNRQFDRLTEDLFPFDPDGKTSRGATVAIKKRDALHKLWESDPRVAPWGGTAYGALQAVNTWQHHMQTVRGGNRAERNMMRAVTGDATRADVDTVSRVLALV